MCVCLWAVECRDLYIWHYDYYLGNDGPCLSFALGVLGAGPSFGEFHFFLNGGFPFLFLANHGTAFSASGMSFGMSTVGHRPGWLIPLQMPQPYPLM